MPKSCFRSKVEVLRARQSKRSGDVEFHVTVAAGGAEPNSGVDAVVVLCAQKDHFCYCMHALPVNVFFAFAAKLHFVCIFTVYLVPPSWLPGALLSSDGVKMQILCLQFAYFC